MKTKKVLALVVLAAFLISIVPFAAFGAINTYSSVVKAPDSSVEAQAVTDSDEAAEEDGAEFTVVLNRSAVGPTTEYLYVAASRPSITFFSWDDPDADEDWTPIELEDDGDYAVIEVPFETDAYSVSVDIKVVSNASGTTNIVFGDSPTAVENYAKGRAFDYLVTGSDDSLANIIQEKKFPVEFDPATATDLSLRVKDNEQPANGVDTSELIATVYANNVPVAGKEVNFSITKGSGATLTATKATTDVTGEAKVKIYATRAYDYEVRVRVSGIPFDADDHVKQVKFITPGITSIKAESDNNQKVARDSGTFKLRFSAYDASGNRVNIDATDLKDKMTRSVIAQPSGGGLSVKDSEDNTKDTLSFYLEPRDNDNDANIVIKTDDLKKDGDYEVRVHLDNGSSVSYKFNAKEQGDIVRMELDYGATSFAGESTVPSPDILYYDAEDYKKKVEFEEAHNVKLSISDASFLDGGIKANGSFKLKEDKSGVITMTAVDTAENLVATQVLNIQKPASYLKLTPQSVGAVGGDVTVNIELVDVDGQLAAAGRDANDSATSATIISKPAGAIASADSVSTSDFAEGKASVKVSSNMEGDVTLQVIITEQDEIDTKGNDNDSDDEVVYSGKVYTGACTVSFGKASEGSGQVIFIVGAPSYVSGNQVFAAESPSFIDNGRTFLGVRDMGTSIGATIEWDQASQTATLSKDGVTIKVTVGANKIAVTKSGVTSEIEIDAAAQNKNGRVYLPFRAVMEAFNYTVTFDQATNSIVCTL